MRFATYSAALSRDGPGLLLMDILEPDAQAQAAARIIAAARPDVILLTEFDYDYGGAALSAFADLLRAQGLDLPEQFAARPNSGLATGLDLDGNGRAGEPRDAQGYGRFGGNAGMALLSRWPLVLERDFTTLLWRDLPGAHLPRWPDGRPFPSEAAMAVQRLSTTAHWVLRLDAPGGPVTVMAWAGTPPVFDGPEDRNGLRAADEALLWRHYLDGDLGPPPQAPFVLMGLSNLDPVDGDGGHETMATLLADPRLIDPAPASEGGALAAGPDQYGDPSLDTADWEEPSPGNLRVSYILPSRDWQVDGAGVFWPAPGDPQAALLGSDGLAAGPHRLVWVDLRR